MLNVLRHRGNVKDGVRQRLSYRVGARQRSAQLHSGEKHFILGTPESQPFSYEVHQCGGFVRANILNQHRLQEIGCPASSSGETNVTEDKWMDERAKPRVPAVQGIKGPPEIVRVVVCEVLPFLVSREVTPHEGHCVENCDEAFYKGESRHLFPLSSVIAAQALVKRVRDLLLQYGDEIPHVPSEVDLDGVEHFRHGNSQVCVLPQPATTDLLIRRELRFGRRFQLVYQIVGQDHDGRLGGERKGLSGILADSSVNGFVAINVGSIEGTMKLDNYLPVVGLVPELL